MAVEQPGWPLLDLVAVMDRLRSPGGCPWDREQTHASRAPYLLEETHETLEAIDSGDDAHLREELGDLLLQVVFHARIAAERPGDPWTIDDVAGGITEKLVRRHPHVFADAEAPTAAHVEQAWERLKAAEKQRASVLDGIPVSLPALAAAQKTVSRARRVGR
jgi:XTP/dITP diphosphohydrolase